MTDPNFLFSLPPFIEQYDGIPYIVIEPGGSDDSARFQAAANRLTAIGGGVLRASAGEFHLEKPFYIDERIRFG